MKYLVIALLILAPFSSHAFSGVIVEVSGDVTVTSPSKETKVIKAGVEFADESTIETRKASSAVILLSNGTIKKLGSKQKYVARGIPSKKDSTFVASLSDAARNSLKDDEGASAHFTAKKVAPGGYTTPPKDTALIGDLVAIATMELSPEATSFLKAKVYYNYGKNALCIMELQQFCNDSSCPNEAMKDLLTKASGR